MAGVAAGDARAGVSGVRVGSRLDGRVKRSSLKRGKGPASDPEKVRAFVQRGREAGARSLREVRDAARAQLTDAARAQLAVPDTERFGGAGAKAVRFRRRAPASEERCATCRRSRAAHWHHWLKQQHVRAYVRSLRIRDDGERRRVEHELLHDPRNLSALCADCHALEDGVAVRLVREDVPASAFEFAAELGGEYTATLLKCYPAAADRGKSTSEEE